MLCDNTAYCVKLSGEDLSRYWNKIETESDVTTTFFRACPTTWRKKAAVRAVWYKEITSLSPYIYRFIPSLTHL